MGWPMDFYNLAKPSTRFQWIQFMSSRKFAFCRSEVATPASLAAVVADT